MNVLLFLTAVADSSDVSEYDFPVSKVQQVAFGQLAYGSLNHSYVEFFALGFTNRLCTKEDCSSFLVTVLPQKEGVKPQTIPIYSTKKSPASDDVLFAYNFGMKINAIPYSTIIRSNNRSLFNLETPFSDTQSNYPIMVLYPPQEKATLVHPKDIDLETIHHMKNKNIWLAADIDGNSTVDLMITKSCCEDGRQCNKENCYQAFAQKDGKWVPAFFHYQTTPVPPPPPKRKP